MKMNQIIPALPGFTILSVHKDSNKVFNTFETPIIAWAIYMEEDDRGEVTTISTPVTMEDLPIHYAIIDPCGVVIVQMESTFETKEEAIKYLRDRII